QVCLRLRGGRSVGTEAGGGGEYACEWRSYRSSQAEADSGLNDTMARDDASAPLIEVRPIQGMGQDGDQPPGRVARGVRIRVQRDDEADGGQPGSGALDRCETRVARPAQEPVELVQLAALALPAHPTVHDRVPTASAMQQEEPGGPVRGMAFVERPNLFDGRL